MFSCNSLRRSPQTAFFLWMVLLVPAISIPLRVDRLSGAPTAEPPTGTAGISAEKDRDITALETGKPIERELAPDEVHTYQLTLSSGQYIQLLFSRISIEVFVRVLGPGGNKLEEKSSKLTLGLPISLVTEDTGSYRLEVRPAEKDAPAGRYELKIEERRAATAQDKDRIAAARASAEGIRFYGQQTAESLRMAIQKYQEALTLWRSLGARDEEAGALNAIGGFHSLLRENQKALDYYNQALPGWRTIGDRKGEAEALNMIGQVYGYLGEHRKALDYFNQALPLRRAAGDRLGEGKTISNIGLMYSRLGEKQKALDLPLGCIHVSRGMEVNRQPSMELRNG